MKLASVLVLSLMVFAVESAPQKILFGSCSKQDKPMPIFDAINQEQPDLFVFLGDNIYGDTEDMEVLANKYKQFGQHKGLQKLRASTPVIATWDDHDFGENDAGAEYPHKEASRKIMLDFWGEDKDSPRYSRPDGIYTSYFYGEGEQRVQVILLDLRWNRSELKSVSTVNYLLKRKPNNMGPYSVNDEAGASMLGEKQWQWLQQELKKPAKLKIIGSSLQLIPEFTGWESWANFPQDRNRLFSFIEQQKINGVLFISGDTHWGEVSKLNNEVGYPLWEVTSSGLTEEWKDVSPNKHRLGNYTHSVNYGFIEIDWDKKDPLINFGLKDVSGEVFTQHKVKLSDISPY